MPAAGTPLRRSAIQRDNATYIASDSEDDDLGELPEVKRRKIARDPSKFARCETASESNDNHNNAGPSQTSEQVTHHHMLLTIRS